MSNKKRGDFRRQRRQAKEWLRGDNGDLKHASPRIQTKVREELDLREIENITQEPPVKSTAPAITESRRPGILEGLHNITSHLRGWAFGRFQRAEEPVVPIAPVLESISFNPQQLNILERIRLGTLELGRDEMGKLLDEANSVGLGTKDVGQAMREGLKPSSFKERGQ